MGEWTVGPMGALLDAAMRCCPAPGPLGLARAVLNGGGPEGLRTPDELAALYQGDAAAVDELLDGTDEPERGILLEMAGIEGLEGGSLRARAALLGFALYMDEIGTAVGIANSPT